MKTILPTFPCEHYVPVQASAQASESFSGETVPARFQCVVEKHPQRVALRVNQEQSFTFEQLDGLSNALANTLVEQYPFLVKAEQQPVVAVFLQEPLAATVAIVALFKLGAVSVNLNAANPPDYVQFQIQKAGARLLIGNEAELAQQPDRKRKQFTLVLDELPGDNSLNVIPREITPETLIGLNFTSGTTGKPKAIARNHRTAVMGAVGFATSCALTPHDTLAMFDTFNFAGGRATLFATLLNGATLHVLNLKTLGLSASLQALEHSAVTMLKCTPSIFRQFSAPEALKTQLTNALARCKLISLEGEAVAHSDIALFKACAPAHAWLRITYSSTELGNVAQCFVSKQWQEKGGPIPAGFVSKHLQVQLVEPFIRNTDGIQTGRLQFISKYLPAGYWRADQVSKRFFVAEHTFLSGDRGYIDGNLLFITGRNDAPVKLRGFRIEPTEIEQTIVKILPVLQCAVDVKPLAHKPDTQRLVAYVKIAPQAKLEPMTFRAKLHIVLPEYCIPQRWIEVNDMPITLNGKVDKNALPELTNERQEPPTLLPSNPTEQVLGELWEQAIGIKPIGRNERFYDLGGDSLAGMQIIVGLEQKYGRPFTTDLLVDNPTIEEMARKLSAPQQDPVCLELQKGDGPQIFYISPLRGDALHFCELMRKLPRNLNVFGLQNMPLTKQLGKWRTWNVEYLANLYLTKTLPRLNGQPIIIIGKSLGGVMAYRLAQLLQARGIEVSYLVLLDTYGPNAQRNWSRYSWEFYKSKWKTMKREHRKNFIKGHAKLNGEIWFWKTIGIFRAARWQVKSGFGLLKTKRQFIPVAPNYCEFEPYLGRAILMRAQHSTFGSGSADYGWGKLIEKLEIIDTPGEHWQTTEGAGGLIAAEVLKRKLRELR